MPLKACIQIIAAVQGLSFRCQGNEIMIGPSNAGKILECRVFPLPVDFLTHIAVASSNATRSRREIDIGEYFWANSKTPAPPMWIVPGTNLVVRIDTKQGNARVAALIAELFSPVNK